MASFELSAPYVCMLTVTSFAFLMMKVNVRRRVSVGPSTDDGFNSAASLHLLCSKLKQPAHKSRVH